MAIIRDFQDTDLRDVFGQVSRLRKVLCRVGRDNYASAHACQTTTVARSKTPNGNRPLCLREPHFP